MNAQVFNIDVFFKHNNSFSFIFFSHDFFLFDLINFQTFFLIKFHCFVLFFCFVAVPPAYQFVLIDFVLVGKSVSNKQKVVARELTPVKLHSD